MRDEAFDRAVLLAASRYANAGHIARARIRGKMRIDPVYRELLDRGIADAGRIVDLGCGRGLLFSLILAAQRNGTHPELLGVELAPSPAAIARAALGDAATIVQGNLASAEVPSCDVVTLLDVAHYLPEAVQDALWASVRRALPVGGRFFVREADATAGAGFLAVRAAERIAAILGGDGLRRFAYRAASELVRNLESAGFGVVASPMSRGTPFANVLLEARALA